MKKITVLTIFTLLAILASVFYTYGRGIWYPVFLEIKGKRSTADVIQEYSQTTRAELSPLFEEAGISYPPKKLALIAFKESNELQVWASDTAENYKQVTTYPVLAASGVIGPKLKEGDKQVPEGIYKIEGFNPNSAYHLSLKLNYPNKFDLKYANLESRSEPGSNIFIHGKAVSVGCLAIGDKAIEQLFTLVHATKASNTSVIISPYDLSSRKLIAPEHDPQWTAELYQNITTHYQKITDNNN